MNERVDDSLQTRRSLLSRLRDLDDHESWRTFFERYWRLLYNVARRSGLDDLAAQEVVQDTVISVARQMPGFHYDPERGTFRQWLLRITRRRLMDFMRKSYRQPHFAEIDTESEDALAAAAAVVDAAPEIIDRAWNEEWERLVFDAAVAQVRAEVNPKQFQVFDFCVLKGLPIRKVTETLGLNAAQVYLAKHRVSRAVKRVARQIHEQGAAEHAKASHLECRRTP
jgi:RNA polymerase sigma-70 factor (ECF subfamily)